MSATQGAQHYILDYYQHNGQAATERLARRAEELAMARGGDVVTLGDCMRAEEEVG